MLRPCTKTTQSERAVNLPKASFDSSSWQSRKRFFILQLLAACCIFKTDAVDVERKTIVREESTLTTKDKASLHQDINTTVVNKTFVKSVVLTRPAAKEESSLQVNATKAAKVAQVPPEAAGVGIALQPQPTVGASVPVLASGVQTTASPLLTAVQPQEEVGPAAPAAIAAAHTSHDEKVAAVHHKHADLVKKKKKEDDDREKAYHAKVIVISVGATLAVLCMCRMCCAGNKKQNNSATARRASFNAAATAFATRRPSGSGDPRRSAQFDAQTLNRSVKKNLRGEQGEASDGKAGSGKAAPSDDQGRRRSSYRERRSKSTERRNSRSGERSGEVTSESASPGERRSDARRVSNGKEATAADAPSLRVIPPADDGAPAPRPSTGSAGSYKSRREASRPRSPSAEPSKDSAKDAELEF